MCGISGLLGPLARESGPIREMVRVQHHRGPDASDHWLSENPPVALGHNRLSILDLSDAGRQPMASRDGRYRIVFNGEIYNYLELREELDGPWIGGSDTEVLLASWDRWGLAALPRLNGMFAFAIWDAEARTLTCVRDRLGIKPFHYAWIGESWAFGSEIKALLAAGLPARPDADTWATYLAHGIYDHGAGTFFAGVTALPGGHHVTIDHSGRRPVAGSPVAWWDPTRAPDLAQATDTELEDRFLELLDDSVRLRRRSDVPVGVNLSGGMDSATLMTAVDRQIGAGAAVETFTAGFGDARYDEGDFADGVPRVANWVRNHEALDVADVWQEAADLTWHQEAPFGGIATLGYFRLHRKALERDVTVLLEGQGGDELLAGYRYFETPFHLDLLKAGQKARLRSEIRASHALGGPSPHDAMAALRALQAAEEAGQSGPARYQDGSSHLRTDLLHPEWVERAGAHPQFAQPWPDHLRNALHRDLRHTKLPRVLRMNDRLSMAHSRELREPYLDHRMVEFCLGLPSGQRIRNGWAKELMRRAAARRIPETLVRTPKRAIVTPQREWLRGPLRPAIEALLKDGAFADRGIFRAEECRAAFDAFCAGDGGNAFFIWQWVSAELWWRRFVDLDDRPLDQSLGVPPLRKSSGRTLGDPMAGSA